MSVKPPLSAPKETLESLLSKRDLIIGQLPWSVGHVLEDKCTKYICVCVFCVK